MDVEDALNVLSEEVPKEKPVVHTDSKPAYDNKKGFNAWEDEIIPRELNKTNLKRFDRTFTVVSAGDVPQEAMDSFKSALETITNLGFTLRASADERDKFSKEIDKNYTRKEYMLPWKKFNEDVTPKVSKPTKYAYELSAFLHKAFKKVPNSVRGFIARNTHLLLGSDCDTPINFLIIYTSCGIEDGKKIDFQTTGNTSYFIDVSDELNVPIFNFKNADAKERLLSFLETFKS